MNLTNTISVCFLYNLYTRLLCLLVGDVCVVLGVGVIGWGVLLLLEGVPHYQTLVGITYNYAD